MKCFIKFVLLARRIKKNPDIRLKYFGISNSLKAQLHWASLLAIRSRFK